MYPLSICICPRSLAWMFAAGQAAEKLAIVAWEYERYT